MAMGDGGAASLASLGAAPQARHLGGSSGFVNEYELCGIEIELPVEPGFSRRFHVRALLFACMRRFF